MALLKKPLAVSIHEYKRAGAYIGCQTRSKSGIGRLMDGRIDGWFDGWMDRWVCRWIDGWMGGWIT